MRPDLHSQIKFVEEVGNAMTCAHGMRWLDVARPKKVKTESTFTITHCVATTKIVEHTESRLKNLLIICRKRHKVLAFGFAGISASLACFSILTLTVMATPTKEHLLFVGLPNEVSISVLHEIGFYDLISAFFVSGLWAQTIDWDDVMRAKMFRLPKGFRKEDSDRKQDLIQILWKRIYEEIDEDENPWDYVEINPLFNNDKKACVGKQGAYKFKIDQAFSTYWLTDILTNYRRLLRQLCGSRLRTYPPVQCTKNGMKPPRQPPRQPPRRRLYNPFPNFMPREPVHIFYRIGVDEDDGVTIKNLYDYIHGDLRAWEQCSMVPGASCLGSRYVWLVAPSSVSEAT